MQWVKRAFFDQRSEESASAIGHSQIRVRVSKYDNVRGNVQDKVARWKARNKFYDRMESTTRTTIPNICRARCNTLRRADT